MTIHFPKAASTAVKRNSNRLQLKILGTVLQLLHMIDPCQLTVLASTSIVICGGSAWSMLEHGITI